MRVYLVGGAVRDLVMGVTPKDRDYVVVGATTEEMIAKGFSKVGASFPVFLHPTTGDEFALARQERKVGVGYNGFDVISDPSITLEDDLSRRDLTMNAMAIEIDEQYRCVGDLVDPFRGQDDIKHRVIRHTTAAFAEDPVRILRAARFAARYGFDVEPSTLAFMDAVVDELQFVPRERIWAEFERGLLEQHPDRMIQVLRDCNALRSPTLSAYRSANTTALQRCTLSHSLAVRFALTGLGFHPADYKEHTIPTRISLISDLFNRFHTVLTHWDMLTSLAKVEVFAAFRAMSDRSTLHEVLTVLVISGEATEGDVSSILSDLDKATSIDAQALANTCSPCDIGLTIKHARAKAVQQ